MKTFVCGLCLAVFLIGSAGAEPLTLTTTRVDNGWQKVRRHCDQFRRCWDESRRNPLLESFNYARMPQQTGRADASKRPGVLAKR